MDFFKDPYQNPVIGLKGDRLSPCARMINRLSSMMNGSDRLFFTTTIIMGCSASNKGQFQFEALKYLLTFPTHRSLGEKLQGVSMVE